MKIKLCRIKKNKGNKKILHEIMMNQNEIISSTTTDNSNKSKETPTELSEDIDNENQELKHLIKSYIMKISMMSILVKSEIKTGSGNKLQPFKKFSLCLMTLRLVCQSLT